MAKIYISGPISGTKDYRDRFKVAAQQIRAKGHEPVNPCDLDRILDPATTTWTQFMLADIGLLKACDAVVVLEGWESSRGAKIEVKKAQELGMTVYKQIDNIPEGREVREDG